MTAPTPPDAGAVLQDAASQLSHGVLDLLTSLAPWEIALLILFGGWHMARALVGMKVGTSESYEQFATRVGREEWEEEKRMNRRGE